MREPRSELNSGAVGYSVVIPVYNSATMLSELHARLTSVMQGLDAPYEIIFVEDCGPDNAWGELERLSASDERVVAVQLMKNSGQSNATLCGLSQAKGDVVFTMDDDLQHPPEELPMLLNALGPRDDVVMGVPREKKHNVVRRLGSESIHLANSYLLGKDRKLRFTSFRALRRPVVDGILQLQTLSPALGPMINSVTRHITNVVASHSPRKEGRSGYTLSRIFRQTMSNFIGYSILPLRMLGIMGALGIVFSIVLAIIYISRYMTGGINVPGWTTIALLLVMISGFNFFAFALLGEYVLRILQRANATPQYIIRQTSRSTAKGSDMDIVQEGMPAAGANEDRSD